MGRAKKDRHKSLAWGRLSNTMFSPKAAREKSIKGEREEWGAGLCPSKGPRALRVQKGSGTRAAISERRAEAHFGVVQVAHWVAAIFGRGSLISKDQEIEDGRENKKEKGVAAQIKHRISRRIEYWSVIIQARGREKRRGESKGRPTALALKKKRGGKGRWREAYTRHRSYGVR